MKKKSSGVAEFATVGALAKVSRNSKINRAGDTMLLASVILAIGELIKLPFKLCYYGVIYIYKLSVWSVKLIYNLFKYSGLFIVEIAQFINKASKYIKTKNEQHGTAK